MAGKVGNDRRKSDAASVFYVLAEGCAPPPIHARTPEAAQHPSREWVPSPLLFALRPLDVWGRMWLERMLQPHVDPPVSTAPASEVKSPSVWSPATAAQSRRGQKSLKAFAYILTH